MQKQAESKDHSDRRRNAHIQTSHRNSPHRKNARRKQNKHIHSKQLTVCGTNANGIKSKKESLRNLLDNEQPQVFMIQETKVKHKNQIKADGYEIFEKVRKSKGGGGLMIGVSKDIQATPVDVSPQDSEIEILVTEMNLESMKIRFLTAYGPQEDDNEDRINQFYVSLEEEIVKCEQEGCGLIIEMDANAKLGREIIHNDPHPMSNNGKLLHDIIKRRDCSVINASEKCTGTITRSRQKAGIKEESIIDFVIVNAIVLPYVQNMEIDESKAKSLTRFHKGKTIPSDHNTIKCIFNIPVHKRRECRKEVYRIRDEDGLKEFKVKTTETKRFTRCFQGDGTIEQQGKMWLKQLQKTIHVCFKKVRLRTSKKVDSIQEKMNERKTIKTKISKAKTVTERHELEDALQTIEEEISMECDEKNYNIIAEQLGSITNKDGGTHNAGVWRLRKKLFPKPMEQLSAKKDKEGNITTNPDTIKEIYLDAYSDRLKHREMNPGLLKLKLLREELFQQRLKICKSRKSPAWTIDDLDKVLGKLKSGKASDPLGLVNELFQLKNIGDDLKESILLMLNKIKEEFNEPEFMRMANITSFWKGKGDKTDIDTERGIFILIIIRMIKDRLIYNDIKTEIEMSDSQVGARNDYNIRNHLFVIYSVLNSVTHRESPPVDIHMYDISKCFDGLWLEECCNNLFEAGVTDDKLAMIYEGNKMNHVAVKTPNGLTDRVLIERIVTQGGVTGPVCCAVQTDQIGKYSLDSKQFLYMYKDKVGIPALAMVDDIAKISLCGTNAVKDNAYINARIEQDKQSFNTSKCHSLHAGRQERPCSLLKAHSNIIDIVDNEKYVGDIITDDGKHSLNVTARRSKGIGMCSEITNILDGLCLGAHYFKVAMMLRTTMLLQVLLSNAETWLRLLDKDMKKLEGVDRIFLRKIMHAPKSTPTVALYLETGCVPITYTIKYKRIMFLHHILTRETDSLISQVYQAQVQKPVKGDWCLVVREDLSTLGLDHLNDEKIKEMSKDALQKVVKENINKTALHNLKLEKNKLKKLNDERYTELSMQSYLLTGSSLSTRNKRLSFRWRTKTINVGYNMGMKDAMCPLCKLSKDTQEHLLTCPVVKGRLSGDTVKDIATALRIRETFIKGSPEEYRVLLDV